MHCLGTETTWLENQYKFLKEKREIRKEGSFWQNIPNSRDLLERFSRFDDAGVAMVIL